jgi:acyl carrier protein
LCSDGDIGEIWISGDSVAQGYWSDPQRTVQTFAATLEPPDGQTWLRSGDLGFLRDGELFVSGRLKDLIIVRGVNYFPHELERTAQASHPALHTGGGAAFSIEQHRQEEVVLVHELKRSQRQANSADIFDAIRSAIAQEHELEMHAILLVRPGQLPRTSSGKMQRHLCRRRFLAGEFEPIAQWIRPQAAPAGGDSASPGSGESELEAWLAGRVAAALGCPADQIDRAAPLARYGIGSADAVGLAGEISQQLSLDLPATLLWDYPSLQELARYLATARQESSAAAEGVA